MPALYYLHSSALRLVGVSNWWSDFVLGGSTEDWFWLEDTP